MSKGTPGPWVKHSGGHGSGSRLESSGRLLAPVCPWSEGLGVWGRCCCAPVTPPHATWFFFLHHPLGLWEPRIKTDDKETSVITDVLLFFSLAKLKLQYA